MDEPSAEAIAVQERYARRQQADWRYSWLNPAALAAAHERERATARLFGRLGWHDLSARRVLEVGCGTGANLLSLMQLGFSPRNLVGIELLPERFAVAMQRLPAGVVLMQGDASLVQLPDASEDIVLQSTVFSSLLDAPFQW